ncbi:MAG: tRNA epoxyqueuosine(34) reductase QueG, partial [Fidelibacterota bacterium]
MEKVWAQRAGLGWQGKHTNLITRDYGSWVFLGEILLDVELEPDSPFEEDLCGSCTACLEACPTGALSEAYRIDAGRCISYLTIEHRGEFSPEQAGWLNGWIFGCDICQEVCPWNVRFARPTVEQAFTPREFITSFSVDDWLGLGEECWDELLRGSAARRARYNGLVRNVRAAGGGPSHQAPSSG